MKRFSVIGLFLCLFKFYESTILQCPTLLEIPINTLGGREINLADFASKGNVTFSPSQMVSLNFSNLNEPLQVKISIMYENGTKDACTFLIYTRAEVCFKESMVSVQNAIQTCYDIGDNISCSYTCKSGYIFYDGNITKTYNCSGMNVWTPSAFPEGCLGYGPHGYQWKVEVLYNINVTLPFHCLSAVSDLFLSQTAKSKMNKYCNISYPEKFHVDSFGTSVESQHKVKSVFQGRFFASLPYRSREICMNHFVNDSTIVTRASLINCSDNSLAHVTLDDIRYSKLRDKCGDRATPLFNLPGIGDICVVCKPGTYYNHNDTCESCSDGFYSIYSQSWKCYPCGYNSISREDKTTCISKCPRGFVYQDGGENCIPCRRNTYWVDDLHCEHCPKGYGTQGNGAYGIHLCKANPILLSCNPGRYSPTGYEPCQECPLHHYQNLQGQTSCNECNEKERTYKTGRISSSECIIIDNPHCDSSLIGCENGSAVIRKHAAICVCFEDQNCSWTNAQQIQEDKHGLFIFIAVLAISALLNLCLILGICRQRTCKKNQHQGSKNMNKDNIGYTPDAGYENAQVIELHYQELGQVNQQHTYDRVQ